MVFDLHVRQPDGAIIAVGLSGTGWISKDDGATWAATCSIPLRYKAPWHSMLVSSQELGHVLALSGGLYRIDHVVEDAGPCPALPLPTKTAFNGAAVSRSRILLKGESAYFYSDDLGQTWVPLPLNPALKAADHDASAFAIDPGNPDRISVATCEGLGEKPEPTDYRLVLRSRSSQVAPFASVAAAVPCFGRKLSIELERDHPDTIYYRSTGEPLVSVDGGKSWVKSTAFHYNSVALREGGFAHMHIKSEGTKVATLAISAGGATGAFAQKGSFIVAAGEFSGDVLQGGRGKFLYSNGGKLHVSVDGGATFKTAAYPSLGVLVPVEVSSRDGKTLWAIDKKLRVAMSPDGGQTWSFRYMGLLPFDAVPTQPRVYVNPYNDASVLVRGEKFLSTYESFRIATTDGFLKADARSVPFFQAWASAVGFRSSSPEAHFVLNGKGAWVGNTTAQSPTPLPLPPPATDVWRPFPDILALPSEPAALFFGENGLGSASRYEAYNTATGARRDVLPAIAMKAAGHAIAHTEQGPRLRVISETGRIRETSDGVAFVDFSPNPSFPPCERRLLSASRVNPGRLVTACLGSKENGVHFSTNGGKAWTHVPADELQGCGITQVAITGTRVFASCSASQKVFEILR